MRIKSYFAKSVDEAMAQAREELGVDALLLNTRKVLTDAGQPGGYEVVFGIATEEAPPAPVAEEIAAPVPAPAEAAAPAPHDDLSGELGRLHARMEEIHGLIERSARTQVTRGRTIPELADVYSRLIAADVDPLLSQEIVDSLESSLSEEAFARTGKGLKIDMTTLEALIRAEVERRVVVDSTLGAKGDEETVVTLVGPTGAGKTTTLMKLAASDLMNGRAVRMISLDTSRVTSQMQLQYFASTLGIAFTTVPSMQGLPGIVEEARKKHEVTLIDLPGYTGHDDAGVETASGVLANCAGVDVHLVVPGYMKSSDLRRCVRRYEAFRPSKLLVTKLDETQTFGSMYSGAAWAGLSLSFQTHGQAIPGDIREASLEDFTAMVLDRQKAFAQHVA